MQNMTIGSTGELVREVQRLLNALGYREADGTPLDVDGEFGPLTEAAVLWFHASHGIGRTAQVGYETMAALRAAQTPTPPGATLAQGALAQMEVLLASNVYEKPWGKNRGGPEPGAPDWCSVDAINAFAGMSRQPWCSMTVWFAFVRGGYPKSQLPPGYPLVASVVAWARRNGLLVDWNKPGNTPRPGDIWTTGDEHRPQSMHTGMVRTVSTSARKITTIEGNANNAVRSLTRRWGDMSHLIRVPG